MSDESPQDPQNEYPQARFLLANNAKNITSIVLESRPFCISNKDPDPPSSVEGFCFYQKLPEPDPGAIDAVPEKVAQCHLIAPVAYSDLGLTIAIDDPLDFDLRDQLPKLLHREAEEIEIIVSPRVEILRVIEETYGFVSNPSMRALSEIGW